MGRWDSHWYGPVAAIRPYLFQRCLLLVVAFDLLVLMVERGGRYGLDSVPFNVPHFVWLDRIHQLILPQGVPTATYYVAVIVTTSFLAFSLVVGGHRRWLQAVVAALYTYGWSMSRLDSYLHHYMLSLILGIMVFFPRIDSRDLRASWTEEFQPSKRKSRAAKPSLAVRSGCLLGLAMAYRIALSQTIGLTDSQRWIAMGVFFVALVLVLMRWKPQEWDKRGPLVSSWAYRLLATTVGVIYVFTSIAKMDQEWCGGHTLRSVGATEDVLSPVARMATATGLQTDTFWSLLATMVIPLELTLAVCYLLAVGQDEPNRKWLRRFCFLGWGLAVGLHLNNEMMNLIIQWFGYYMLLLATIVLLPARILMLLGQFFVWPDCWCRDYLTKRLDDSGSWNSVFGLGVCSTFALISLVTLGFYAHIVGAIVASCLLAFGLVAVLLLGMIPGWRRASMRVAMVTTISSLLMIVAIWQCSMRFDYYDVRGKTLQLLGNDRDAIIEFEHGARLPARTKLVAAELLTNLGVSYRRTGDEAKAEEIYRLAIKKYPAQFLAHYSLGNLLVQQQRLDEAMEYYRNAIAIKSDLSDAYVNLGNVLEFKNRYAEAVECYEAALRAEPKAVDIQQLLQAAREKLK